MPDSERGIAPRALLLTAGLGTRLKPLTYVRAKAAVPVNGEPLARRIIQWLARYDVRDLVLNLHHLPHTIASVVGDGADLGVRVRYSWEQPVLGSAGGPRRALPLLSDDEAPFLIVNGDTLTDLDLNELLAAHAASDAVITMAVIPNPRPDKYGGVLVSPDGRVTGFAGPRRARGDVPTAGVGSRPAGDSYHFIGVQVAYPRAFASLEDGVAVESVGGLYPELIRENPRSIAVHVSRASFQDIGTPRDYLDTSLALAAREGSRLVSGAGTTIHESARLTRSAVWDDVVVGEGATLTECVVGDGARVPAGARYEGYAMVPAGSRAPASNERIESGLLLTKL
jgi:NDP-sugar pyrophosphorylase family protein